MTKRGKNPQGSSGTPKRSKFKARQEDDRALWEAFTQNINPLELKGRVQDRDAELFDEMVRREHAKVERVVIRPIDKRRAAGTAVPKNKPKPIAVINEIDSRQVRRIGNGRSGIDARIDLHGMRQQEAHSALRIFLFRAVTKGHRMVLVITGKGSASRPGGEFSDYVNEGALGTGVLRRNVPIWLEEPEIRSIVVGYTTAHIRHGGDGALYVQLRRQK
jgi:DNA-nicking Smr family endonuclease